MATSIDLTFEDAVTRLNRRNLDNVLRVLGLLSSFEFAGGIEGPLFPLLNSEKVRLLTEAALRSKAAWYKMGRIEAKDIAYYFNSANQALNDPRLDRDIKSGGERDEMLHKLQIFFARFANRQMREQVSPAIAMGQFRAVVEVLPGDSMAAKFATALGMTVSELFSVHRSLCQYFQALGEVVLRRFKLPQRMGTRVDVQADGVRGLIKQFDSHLQYFFVTPELLKAAEEHEAAELLASYAQLFSRGIDEHRARLDRPEYNLGPTGLGLSTLDRFPLVSGQSGGCWYVPNLRTLVGAATPAPHFTLMKRCPDDYADARGFGLEQYLASMVKERMPSLSVIPEKTWPSTMGEVAGPDLILLDHGRKPVTIGIEIKARRMVPSTRFDLGQEELANNYDELWGATARVFNKLDEILGGSSGGYQEFATDLGRAREYPRMAIGIAGEAPYLFGELSTRQAQVDSQNPLHGLSDWTVMSSESFERMIEVTVQDNRELGDVLDDYVEDCHNLELSCPMAEFYRNAEIKVSASYAATFLEGIWPN